MSDLKRAQTSTNHNPALYPNCLCYPWCHHLGFSSFPKPVAWFFGLVNHLLHFSAASHGSNLSSQKGSYRIPEAWEYERCEMASESKRITELETWSTLNLFRNLIYSQSLQKFLLNYSKLQLQCEWCSIRLLARLPAKFDPTLDPNHFDAGPHLQVFAVYGAKTKSIAVLSHVFAVFQVLIVFVNKSPLTMNYDAIKQPKWRKQNMLDCCTNI